MRHLAKGLYTKIVHLRIDAEVKLQDVLAAIYKGPG